MKRTEKDFRNYVKAIRATMPNYNNGRKVVVVSELTKRGRSLIQIGSQWKGGCLEQVYENPSETKQRIFNECLDMYYNDAGHTAFSICSYNSFGFTVSWLSDEGLTILTKDTEYLVVFNE